MGAKNALNEHVSGQSNQPLSQPAHALTHQQVADELHSDVDNGLKATEAKQRADQYGPNELGDDDGVNVFKIFIGQIANAMTLVSLQSHHLTHRSF